MGISPTGPSNVPPPEPLSGSYKTMIQKLLSILQTFFDDVEAYKASPKGPQAQKLWDAVQKMLPTVAKDIELVAQHVGEDSQIAKTGRGLLAQMQNIVANPPGSKAFQVAVTNAFSLAGTFIEDLQGG